MSKLNGKNIPNTICAKTWNDLIISLPNRTVKWCCKTTTNEEQNKQLKFDLDTLNEQGMDFFVKNPILMNRKYELSGGIRCTDCIRCWETEDATGQSVRTNYEWGIEDAPEKQKALFRKALVDDKFVPAFQDSIVEMKPFDFVEIELTNRCNMACVYCWEGLSSRWQKETGKKMPDTDDAIFEKVIELLKEYWINEQSKKAIANMVNFSILGGEPFFTEHMFKFLNDFIVYVNDTKPEGMQVIVTVTTNLNFPEKKLIEFFEIVEKTPNIQYITQISSEAVGRKSELIRWGSNWEKYDKTLGDFMELAKKHNNIMLGFGCAHNSLSLPYVKEYFEYLNNKLLSHNYEDEIYMHTNWVDKPKHLGISMVDRKHLTKIDEAIDYFKNEFTDKVYDKHMYLQTLNTVRNIVDSDVSDDSKIKAYDELSKIEKRRNISFAEHFPHYSELIKNPDK